MADSLTVQPLDFTVLIETAATPVTRMETTARDFAQTKLHCLQLNASVGMQRVKAKVFIQDPFNPVLFTEDSERYVDVRNIVCALTSYNYSEDILQFEEDDVILLLDVFQHIYQ